MIYTAKNCMPRAMVVDDATGANIDQVVSIDTDAKTLTRYEMPLRVDDNDIIVTYTRGFDDVKISNDSRMGLPHLFEVRGLQP